MIFPDLTGRDFPLSMEFILQPEARMEWYPKTVFMIRIRRMLPAQVLYMEFISQDAMHPAVLLI